MSQIKASNLPIKNFQQDFGAWCGKNNNLSGGRNHKLAAKRAKNFGTAQAPYKCTFSGVPLKVIQKISGHKTLSALQKYLEVLDEDLESAIATLNFSSEGGKFNHPVL